MSGAALPYYKRFPRDFLEGTIGMSFEEKGAYAIVLDLIYMRGGNLPDDERYIAGQLGCSVKLWKSLRGRLITLGKLACENGTLSNSRASEELENQRKYQDQQAEKRRKNPPNSAEISAKLPRKSPEKSLTDSVDGDESKKIKTFAKPLIDQPEPEPIYTTEANASVERASAPTDTEPVVVALRSEPPRAAQPRGSARGSRIAPNWQPTPADYAFASGEGMTREEINREADKFRDHWASASGRSAAKCDWSATWRNWIRSDIRKRGSFAARPRPTERERAAQTLSAFDRVAAMLDGDAGRPADPARPDPGTIDGEYRVIEPRTALG